MPSDSDVLRSATFLRRASAYSIDAGIVTIVWFFALVAATSILDEDDDTESFMLGLVIFLFGPVAWFGYQWFCNSRGTSLGKKAVGIHIESSAHAPGTSVRPGGGAALIRTFGQVLGVVPLGLGFWSALWDAENRAWHDRLSGTRVIRLPTATQVAWVEADVARGEHRLLAEVLEGPMPPAGADGSVDLRFEPGWIYWPLGIGGILAVVTVCITGVFILSPQDWEKPEDFLVAAALFGLPALVLLGLGLGFRVLLRNALTVGVEEIGLKRLIRAGSIPWTMVSSVEARRDLRAIRVTATGTRLTWNGHAFPAEDRKRAVLAIRGRLPPNVQIEEWRR